MKVGTDYLNPKLPNQLTRFRTRTIVATDENLKGYGQLVSKEDYKNFPIEIVQWPKPHGRPVDDGTGNEAGTREGVFEFWWEGEVLFGKNNAVNDEYLLGWSVNPKEAIRGTQPDKAPEQLLLWHANYHPDGGQLFFPLTKTPFVSPLALPGDDISPEKFINFYFDGSHGLYIHPSIWHEGVFPIAPRASFFDKQGSVHARVSVNFATEFGGLLELPFIQQLA